MTRKLVAENWRLEQARYGLEGSHCTGCDGYHFPKKMLCLRCKTDENLEDYKFKQEGKLVEWTKIYDAAKGFDFAGPYYYCLVELEEGIKIATQLKYVKDESLLKPGMKVKLVFRRLFSHGLEGLNTYGFKATPVIE